MATNNNQNQNELIVRRPRVPIATVWGDGNLDTQEVNVMKDLLFRLPRAVPDGSLQYTAAQWAQIEMYIEAPVPPSERGRLIDDLQSHIHSTADKELVINSRDELVRGDGAVSPEDEAVIMEIGAAIDNIDSGFFGELSGA